jgi:hypothetical protein
VIRIIPYRGPSHHRRPRPTARCPSCPMSRSNLLSVQLLLRPFPLPTPSPSTSRMRTEREVERPGGLDCWAGRVVGYERGARRKRGIPWRARLWLRESPGRCAACPGWSRTTSWPLVLAEMGVWTTREWTSWGGCAGCDGCGGCDGRGKTWRSVRKDWSKGGCRRDWCLWKWKILRWVGRK